MPFPTIDTLDDLAQALTIVSGELDPKKFTLYGIFRDEYYFLESFFSHYRSIGVEQFLIVDDSSVDGTREFLTEQTDCVVLQSPYSYGQRVICRQPPYNRGNKRAGLLMKAAIPRRFMRNQWALYADADEFLTLPPGIGTIQALVGKIEERGYKCAVASLVDFYPSRFDEQDDAHPKTFGDLLRNSPYFDAIKLLEFGKDGGDVISCNRGATARLLSKYAIGYVPIRLESLPNPIKRALGPIFREKKWGATMKTPLSFWDEETRLLGAHKSNLHPAPGLIICLAHFKFNPDLRRRIQMGTTLRSFAGNSMKYFQLAIFLRKASKAGKTLLGPDSKRFETAADLVKAGLLAVPQGF
jgi:hypothetical protein